MSRYQTQTLFPCNGKPKLLFTKNEKEFFLDYMFDPEYSCQEFRFSNIKIKYMDAMAKGFFKKYGFLFACVIAGFLCIIACNISESSYRPYPPANTESVRPIGIGPNL
ncbi:MAG: hypothetical protein JWM20_644 [Patescibacteria group bacterium]|nr:hypothetical protein [Patescibacteria group bacterium]